MIEDKTVELIEGEEKSKFIIVCVYWQFKNSSKIIYFVLVVHIISNAYKLI